MAHVLITGSTDGLGRAAAQTLHAEGHRVVVHARHPSRLDAVRELLDQGVEAVVGDLSDLSQTVELAARVNRLGPLDAVIHNAGVYTGPAVLAVNAVAPYVLTALIARPKRLIYLSSRLHRRGHARLDGLDGNGATVTYSDSKLFVTTLAAAVARRWPDVPSHAVDPGWVPTKMGGPQAPDDFRLGHRTQEWLATGNDADALTTGGYWHHGQRQTPHPAVHDTAFQDRLLEALARATGVALP